MVKINKNRTKAILENINDKDSFMMELISAINMSIEKNDPSFVEKCLNEWEASAELNCIPRFSKKVCNRFNSLVRAGLIK